MPDQNSPDQQAPKTSPKTPRDTLRDTLGQRRAKAHARHADNIAARLPTVMLQHGWLAAGSQGAIYNAFRTEVPTGALIDAALDAKCRVALPRVLGQQMVFLPYTHTTCLETSRFGIQEPPYDEQKIIPAENFDWIVLPLLGFDRQGNRLGYGAGHYDKALSFMHGDRPQTPLLIGVAYADQEVAEGLPAEDWDVPLDIVITESEVITCRKPAI